MLGQKVEQRERLDFCSLALMGDGGQLLGDVSKVEVVCVNNLQDGWGSALFKATLFFFQKLMFTDVDKDSQNGESSRVPQGSGEIRVDGFHVDDVHLEGEGGPDLRPACGATETPTDRTLPPSGICAGPPCAPSRWRRGRPSGSAAGRCGKHPEGRRLSPTCHSRPGG